MQFFADCREAHNLYNFSITLPPLTDAEQREIFPGDYFRFAYEHCFVNEHCFVSFKKYSSC